MSPVGILYSLYIEPRMGHVIIYCIGWVLDKPHVQKKLCLIFFLLNYGSR